MGKKVRSSKGEMVDFDLLKIKQQIGSAPPSADVRARQNFIEKRLRRRVKKVEAPAPKIKNADGDSPLVSPKMPSTEDFDVETKFIDLPDDDTMEVNDEPKAKSRRQRARPLTPKAEDNESEE